MPAQDSHQPASTSTEQQLFQFIKAKQLDQVRQLIKDNPKLNLNCIDGDELTPLQHVCHNGHFEMAQLLLDKGAKVNYTNRKDGYTPLMFAAISSRKDIVRLLLERGADTTKENCVHRNASQMAAFVGQQKVVSIINSWIPYENSVKPYTICRALEDKPRISTPKHAKLLHDYIVYPSLHPVKLILFIREHLDLVKCANQFIYVLENLSSKSSKAPDTDDYLSLKYYYLYYIIEYCVKTIKAKDASILEDPDDFKLESCEKVIEHLVRRLIKKEDPKDTSPALNRLIVECLMKFPYTHLAIFKSTTFALSKLTDDMLCAYTILVQVLNGPQFFGHQPEACAVCGEVDSTLR